MVDWTTTLTLVVTYGVVEGTCFVVTIEVV